MWRTAIEVLEKTIGEHKWIITIALFGFVLIKVLVIARGNTQIALGIFNSAGAATVVVGGILSAFSLVSALTFGLAIALLVRTFPLIRTFPSIIKIIRRPRWLRPPPVTCYYRTSRVRSPGKLESTRWHAFTGWVDYIVVNEKPVWLTGLIAAVICFFITPWPLAVASGLLGVLLGTAAKIRKGVIRAISLGVVSGLSIFLVLYPLLYAVWLPHEILTVSRRVCPSQAQKDQVIGYVLSDSNGWISLLVTHQRIICRIKSEEVTARQLCQSKIISMPGMWEWYKRSDPLEKKFFRPLAATKLPACP
jgi:hypothetical protein